MRKILFVVLSVMIGQFTGSAQSVSGKEAKEILMSKVWSYYGVMNLKYSEDKIYYYDSRKSMEESRVVCHRYYLSDIFVKEFDDKLLGVSIGSKYLYLAGSKVNSSFSIYEITEISNEGYSLQLIYDSKDPDGTKIYIGRTKEPVVYVPYRE